MDTGETLKRVIFVFDRKAGGWTCSQIPGIFDPGQIATINAWNRFGIGFRDVPGRYKPAKHQ